MTWLARSDRALVSAAIATLAACLPAGCSSSASAPASPAGPDGSNSTVTVNEDAAVSDPPLGDAAVTDPVDTGPDVFASCPTSRPSTGSFPADVAQVLANKCQTCHQTPTKQHAPFPLLTYAQTQAADPLTPYSGVPIWQVMHSVIQPAGVPHMPFGNAPQLTSAEFATLDDWLLSCALPASMDEGGANGGTTGDGAAEGGTTGDGGAAPADGSADSPADAGEQ